MNTFNPLNMNKFCDWLSETMTCSFEIKMTFHSLLSCIVIIDQLQSLIIYRYDH